MILCCGEALIDMLPRQTTAGEPSFAPHPGGAAFNSSIALGRLEVPVRFFTGLSTDLFGRTILAELTASGVDTSVIHMSDRPTTLSFVRLKDGQASYEFYDENTAGRMLSVEDLPALNNEIQIAFVGGISLVVEPCGTAYTALAQKAHDVGKLVMVDPNIRPSFISDETAYRKRIEQIISVADIVKLSDDDLHWLAGPGDIADLANSMLKQGPSLICITEGSKGATGFSAAGAVSVEARKVETVVDTVGAGDTFNAGILAALHDMNALSKDAVSNLSDDAVTQILGLGTRAAAVTVSRAGANPPRRSEL